MCVCALRFFYFFFFFFLGLGLFPRRTVTLTVPASRLGFHRDDGSYVVEPGPFELYVGSSSSTTLRGEFEVVEPGGAAGPLR